MVARRKRYHQKKGSNILLALLGFILLFVFPIGTVFGVLLLAAASRGKIGWRCGNCGNPLADKEVLMCPACTARLEEPRSFASFEGRSLKASFLLLGKYAAVIAYAMLVVIVVAAWVTTFTAPSMETSMIVLCALLSVPPIWLAFPLVRFLRRQ